MSQLTQCCPQTTTDELVDIREVTVDKDLPKEERIAAFLHQIKNPYRFWCPLTGVTLQVSESPADIASAVSAGDFFLSHAPLAVG